MRKLDLVVHLCTKLNRSHLLTAKTSLILPVLGRTDLDIQASGPQALTVEDSMSMVHASRGFLKPPSDQLRSEPAIIAGIAKATLGDKYGIDWDGFRDNYELIRNKLEIVFPDFHDFNKRVKVKGGFRLTVAAAERRWDTPSGKANFLVSGGLDEDPKMLNPDALVLMTMRSHEQYNTTVYSLDDRYRGIFGRRDVILMNAEDLAARGLAEGDKIDVVALQAPSDVPMTTKAVRGYTAVRYNIPRGAVAGYYPELNAVVALGHYDKRSGTPAYKGVPVEVRRSSLVSSESQPQAKQA